MIDFSKLIIVKPSKKKKIVIKERVSNLEVSVIYDCVVWRSDERCTLVVRKVDTQEVEYSNEFPYKYLAREYKYLDFKFGKGTYTKRE